MDNAQVTEADRKAYLALNMLPEKYREAIMAGEWDSTTGMQVLARHRLERSEPVGWMGIESAPKDGHFLLWCSDLRAERPERVKKPVGVVMGHSFDGYLSGTGMNGNWTFTHWMPLPSAPGTTPPEPVAEIERLVEQIVRDVAELPDRTSPIDWPEAMYVTADELAEIVRAALGDAS